MDFSCGCLFNNKVREPHFKKSKHFEDLAASFAINTKNEQLTAHYSWLVQMHKPLAGQQSEPYIEAVLENPSDKSDPIRVPAMQLKNSAGMEQFEHSRYYILSPSLPSLNCGLYHMQLNVYTDKTKQKLLATHENDVLSRINTDTCPKTEFLERMHAAARQAQHGWQSHQQEQ